MALSGVHVSCTRLGSRFGASLMTNPDWSETLASPGTTANAAPDDNCLMRVSASADSYFAIGTAKKPPDATQLVGTGEKARYFVAAGTSETVFVSSGALLSWTTA